MVAARPHLNKVMFILGSYLAPAGAALLFLLLWTKSHAIDAKQHTHYLNNFYRIQELDTHINNRVLQAEIGGLASYDLIVNELAELKKSQMTLDQFPSFVDPAGQQELTQLLKPYLRVWQAKEKLIHRFNSQNAILRNSQAYFPIAIAQLTQERNPGLASTPRLNTLLQQVLLFNHSGDEALAQQIEDDIQQILADPNLAAQRAEWEGVIAHARIILKYRLEVDTLVDHILRPPTVDWTENLIRAYDQAYQRALNTGDRYRFGLDLLFLGLVVGIAVAIIRKLQVLAKALQKSETKFRNIFENSQVGIFRVKEKTGWILEANQQFLDMFEYDSAADLLGVKRLPDFFVDPDQSQSILEILYTDGEVQNFEVQFRRRDGEIFWGLCSAQMNWKENCLEGVIADINARKMAEAELEAQRAFLNQIIDVVPSAIFVKTLEGCFLTINKAGAAMYGSSVKDMLGKYDGEFIEDPAEKDKLQAIHQKVIATRQTELLPAQIIKNPEGKLRWYQTIISPFMNPDQRVQGTIGSATDITLLKQAEDEFRRAKEAAEAANKAKSTFLANMSHELRTPLNAILGFSQLMPRSGELNPKQQNYLSTISRSGEHLLMLINDVLEMSKVEAGKITLNENNFDLQALLDGLQSMFQLKAESKGLQLRCDRPSHLPQYIRTDEVKLRQVLVNLLGNAIKFTKRGRVTLRVRTGETGGRRQAAGGGRQTARESRESIRNTQQSKLNQSPIANRQSLLFEVEDTGPGIPTEDLQRLFEPFVQTDTGRQAQEGTGLGLPISRKFVELLGGTLRVESRLGQGAIFRFDIQAQTVAANQVERAARDRPIIGLATGQPKYRILITEDKPENRQLLVELLEPVGFEVRVAVNGRDAIALCRQWSPHLIWMDLRMPVMDGYEAARQIKTTHQKPPVIIAITGSAFEEEIKVALSKGCDDFVRKPFRTAEIFEKIAEYLGVRYAYGESAQSLALNPPSESKTDSHELSADSLAIMPASWIQELHQAATKVNAKLILQLIEQIPQSHASVAESLVHMVNNFRFADIVALTQPQDK